MEIEAAQVAVRLRELHASQLPVWDRLRKETRPVRWSDMAILLRGKKSRAEVFSRAFSEAGVPLQSGAGGFFDRREIGDLRNLITLLDNPLQDVALVGVLRSPFGGRLGVNHLATIRMVRRERESSEESPESWWASLQHFVNVGRDWVGKPTETSRDTAALVDSEGWPVLTGEAVFTHPTTAEVAREAWAAADLFVRRFSAWRQESALGPLSLALESAFNSKEVLNVDSQFIEGGSQAVGFQFNR